MSLINDALKQARKVPLRDAANSLTPLQPVAEAASSSAVARLIPGVVVGLIIAAVGFIGWAVAHRPAGKIAAAPEPVAAAPLVAEAAAPLVAPVTPPVVAPPVAELPPPRPPALPKLQGIFYSATAPSAIVDGQTVRPGDPFLQYRVKEITKTTVVLLGADGQTVRLGMGN